MKYYLPVLLITLLPITAQGDSHTYDPALERRVEMLLAQMSLEEKVGQMFMVNIYGTEFGENGATFIREQHPGAVAIFGFNTDGQSAEDLANFLNEMQRVAQDSGAGIPLIVATDQEGGRVRRVSEEVTAFPSPLFLGATTRPEAIQRIGAAAGAELHTLGINMNLAPVADLTTRTDMLSEVRVMYRRTFGEDPQRVGEQVAAYTQGLAESGVIGVLKHFPGHGGAADSHAGLPLVDVDPATAYATSLRPFQVAVQAGVPAVMVGHLYYAQLEPQENLPASLSPTMLGILREEFAFEGIIMTDAMDMAGVANNFYIPDAALMFVQAGGDMFVAGPYMDWNMQRAAMQRLVEAVKDGELPESRIDESVRRILRVKAAYGILDWQPSESLQLDLSASRNALIETFMDAATVVRDENNLLPLEPDDSLAIVYHVVREDIFETCHTLAPEAAFHAYNFQPAPWEYGVVAQLGNTHDKVVIFTEDAFYHTEQQNLVAALPPEKTIVVATGIPYDLEVLGGVSTYLAMYENRPESHIAACRVLFGEHPITGRLPISVGDYPAGSGIDMVE
jgi:beta-N-acetylhexosaminidase